MKSFSPALKASYVSGTTTFATCWKATLTNGTVVTATSLDRDIVFGGLTYKSAQSYTASNIESSAELNPDNLEVEGFLAFPAITDEDIHSGAWDYAEIEVFEVDYNKLSAGRNDLRFGKLGEVRGGRSKFTAEFRGLMQAYTRTIVRLVTKECTADLGDNRCKVDLAGITVNGTVASTSANRIINDPARTEADEWFTGGKLTWVSGANAGRSMEVKRSQQWRLELAHAMYEPIMPGDSYMVYRGCLKRFEEDCIGKFANGLNFRGFPDLPGSKIYRQGGVHYDDSISGNGTGGTGGVPSTGGGGSGGGTGGTSGSGLTYNGMPIVDDLGDGRNNSGWLVTTTGAQQPNVRYVQDVNVTVGDVWYKTNDPSNPWTTDSTKGTLSHITLRKLFTSTDHGYLPGDILDTQGIALRKKIWNSPLGVQKILEFSEGGYYNSPTSITNDWFYNHCVRRVVGDVYEYWDVILLESQDDLDAYLNMPLDWTVINGGPIASSAYSWLGGGSVYEKNHIQYPMSYGGTVVNAGVEEVYEPLSGPRVTLGNANNPYVSSEPTDPSTRVLITAIDSENGMARVTAPGHTFQNGDCVRIAGAYGCNLVTHAAITNRGGAYFQFNELTWLVSEVQNGSFLINFDITHGYDIAAARYAYYTAYYHGAAAEKATARIRSLITSWHTECDSSVLYVFTSWYPQLFPETSVWPRTLVYKSVFAAPGHMLQVGDLPWIAGSGGSAAMDGYPVGGMGLGEMPNQAPLDSSFPQSNPHKGQYVTEVTANTFTVHGYVVVNSQAEADQKAAELRTRGSNYQGNFYVTKSRKNVFGDF